jgi:integrase
MADFWKERNGLMMSSAAPGVWKIQDRPGSWFVRRRVLSEKTGRMVEVAKVLEAPTLAKALAGLDALVELARVGEAKAQKMRFGDYAVSLLDRRIKSGSINSQATVDDWKSVLKRHLIPVFGDHFIQSISRQDVLVFKDELAKRIASKEMGAMCGNNILGRLFCVLNNAAADYEYPSPCHKVPKFKVGRIYTVEEPNVLAKDDVPRFLDGMYRRFPRYYAFTLLMMATGLRPSHIRPIRCRGPNQDILWDKGILLVRRSHTNMVIMDKTKTGRDQAIPLPKDVLDVLRWHIEKFHQAKMHQEGELLFPALRSAEPINHTVLTHAFDVVEKQLKLAYNITPRGGGRRTFTTLTRNAQVNDAVVKSITGHTTQVMFDHYYHVDDELKRSAIAKVIDFTKFRAAEIGSGDTGDVTGSAGSEGGSFPPAEVSGS